MTTTVRASDKLVPWLVTMTAMATVIGAVGPEIWDRVPPNTAAKKTHRDRAVHAGGPPRARCDAKGQRDW